VAPEGARQKSDIMCILQARAYNHAQTPVIAQQAEDFRSASSLHKPQSRSMKNKSAMQQAYTTAVLEGRRKMPR